MMKEFDLNDFGKQMPYHVPEGFFARFPEQVMRKVAVERRRRRMWRLSVGMTAVSCSGPGLPKRYRPCHPATMRTGW